MKRFTRNQMLLLLSIVVLVLAACSEVSPSADAPAPIDIASPLFADDEPVEVAEEQGAVVPTSAPLAVNAAPAVQTMPAVSLQETLVDLYQRTNPSVVFIITASGNFALGTGSGFVYDNEGHIVTNNHVIENGDNYEVVFASGERSFAELVGSDADADLAVIKAETVPADVAPLPLADFDSVQVGQFVIAIGNPFGQQGSMSLGIVSGLDRSLPGEAIDNSFSSYSLPEVIQTDAPINPGNSGGPLLNLAGEVVGVNAAIRTETGVNSGVGFSIPVAAVARIVPDLISEGEYTYPLMGVSVASSLTLSDIERLDLPQTTGAYLSSVSPNGPADRAGLQGADPTNGLGGDLIVALNGVDVRDFSDLNSYLVFNTQPGDTIMVTLVRDGETLTVPLTLGARP